MLKDCCFEQSRQSSLQTNSGFVRNSDSSGPKRGVNLGKCQILNAKPDPGSAIDKTLCKARDRPVTP